MSASAAPVMQSVAAAPAQYVYASPAGYPGAQGAVPMEPVAGQQMVAGGQVVAGAPQVTYTGMSIGTSGMLQQTAGQVTYGAPQVISQGQSVSVMQPGQEVAQTVTYVTQPGQEVQTAPAQYITAAPQYVTPAQPAQVVQEGSAGFTTYGASTMQSYTMSPGVTYGAPGVTTSYQQYGMTQAASTYFPLNVQQAWDNHFSAFGEKNMEKIMLDYDETSVIRVYTNTTGQLAEFRGTMQIRQFFAGVFQEMVDTSSMQAPVQVVEEDYKQVFLVWKCPSSGMDLATDTFIFGPDNKIKRQNIVLEKRAGFVAQAVSAASGRMGAGSSPGRMGASPMGAAAAGAPASMSSAKASEKKEKKDKKDSKKKLSSKKKAKGGFC